jgi:integrase
MTKKLPRGIRIRGDSVVVSFALADGAIERRALGPVSIAYAVQQRAIFQRQAAEGKYEKRKPRAKEKPLTIADLWKTYLSGYKLAGKKAAWRQEGAWKNHLEKVFGEMRPDQLSTPDVVSYQEQRIAAGAGPATVNRELNALKAALNLAHETTLAGGKPRLSHVPHWNALKEPPARSGFIKAPQYAKLCEHASQLWLRAFIACCYTFGFRRGEMLNLRVRQCDFFDVWIQLEEGTTKNDEGRKAHMTSEVFNLLKSCCEGKNPDDLVFTREDGSAVRELREDWYALCVAAGLGCFVEAKRANGKAYDKYVGLQPHDFRRTAVRNLIRRGVPQHIAMKISGHKTEEVFRRYDILDDEDLIDATRKLEAAAAAQNESGTKTDTSAPEPSSDSSHLPRM